LKSGRSSVPVAIAHREEFHDEEEKELRQKNLMAKRLSVACESK